MLKNFTLFLTIATVFSTTLALIPQYAGAEPPQRPQNQVRGSSPQEQALLDALSKTPGYTPAVGRYVKEFKRVHGLAKTQAQHKAAQEQLISKYPNEARFFQAFMQRIVNLQQQQNVQMVLQAIQRDGKMTPKFKQFMNELSSSVRAAKNLNEAKAAQQRVIKKYPNEANLVIQYTNKLRK
jgi:Sec-independent protein translocase protein TatA